MVKTAAEPASAPADELPFEVWEPGTYQHLKLLIYGASGAGKTVFGSTAPNVLFADMEKGMMSVQHRVARWKIEDMGEWGRMLRYVIAHAADFDTLVVDSLNEVQRILMDWVLNENPAGQNGVPRRPYNNQPTQNDYGVMLRLFEERVLRRLKDLPLNVICIGTTSGELSADQRLAPALIGRNTVPTVARYMDVIGYLDRKETGDTITRTLTFDNPRALSKDRTGRLPGSIEDPTWDKLAAFWT